MEINRGTTLDPGRIMVEQCKSDNYETSYITFFNERVHLFGRGLLRRQGFLRLQGGERD